MFSNFSSANGINIGERNVAAVRDALAARGIEIVGEDTGSDHGRSVYFYLTDGRVEVRSVRKGSRVL
jgi:chemotaxis protein CheD